MGRVYGATPQNVVNTDNAFDLQRDELAHWHLNLHSYFDLGTLFTMIAGLLNVLAIYDAYAGPLVMMHDEESDRPPPGSARTVQ